MEEKSLKNQIDSSEFSDSSPVPFSFVWKEDGGANIIDAEGKLVCSLNTGSIDGAYDCKKILANAKRLLLGND